ncbi:Unknown protein, partial [Striga hermonthica]
RRARGHPFAREILAAPLPANFKETNLVYDGSSDPSRHVRTFENMAVLHGYSDSVCCRAFLSTLRGGALDWFHQLPSGSIVDFEDFASKLTNQYSSAVVQEKTYLTLMAMKQGEKESLRKYVARYNKTCLEVHSASDEVKAGGLIRSLRAGPCRTSLAKTPARSYEDVLKRCRKYINLEEMEMEFAKLEGVSQPEPKKEQNHPRGRSPRRNSPKRSERKRASPRRGSGDAKGEKRDEWQRRPMVFERQRYHNFTPLRKEMTEVLEAMEQKMSTEDVTWPKTRFTGTMSGMIMLNNIPVFALFDTGATHSFISRQCLDAIGVHAITAVDTLEVSLASGRKIVTSTKASNLSLSIGGRSLSTDAYVFEMRDFNLILGMDWLSFYHADIRCHDREITLYLPGDESITFFGTRNRSLSHVVSMVKATKLLRRGNCQ